MPDFTFTTVVGGVTFPVAVTADTQAEAAILAAGAFQPDFGDVAVTLSGSVPPDAPSAPATPPAAPAAPTPDPAPEAPAPAPGV